MLLAYEKAFPGSGKQIQDRADREQQFRHDSTSYQMETERIALIHSSKKTYFGQVFSFIVAMTAIGGGIWLISNGQSAGGLTSIIGALVALVIAFVTGKMTESKVASKTAASED